MNFAASIIFLKLLALHQIFGLFLPHWRYHHTHVSHLMIGLGCCIHIVKIQISCWPQISSTKPFSRFLKIKPNQAQAGPGSHFGKPEPCEAQPKLGLAHHYVGVWIFGSWRLSMSWDIMVTDILHQKLVDTVGGLERIPYTYSQK